jgi:hypothetical protein
MRCRAKSDDTAVERAASWSILLAAGITGSASSTADSIAKETILLVKIRDASSEQ